MEVQLRDKKAGAVESRQQQQGMEIGVFWLGVGATSHAWLKRGLFPFTPGAPPDYSCSANR